MHNRQFALDALDGKYFSWFVPTVNRMWDVMSGCANASNPDAMDDDMGDADKDKGGVSQEEFDRQAKLLESVSRDLQVERDRYVLLDAKFQLFTKEFQALKDARATTGGSSVGDDWVAKSVHDKVVEELATLKARCVFCFHLFVFY
jgi:hypothetical protein